MIRVAHLINGLGLGGVTVVVSELLARSDRREIEPSLLLLKAPKLSDSKRAARWAGLADLGIPVDHFDYDVRKKRVIDDLAAWLDRRRPDILHTHSYRPNLFGREAALRLGRSRPRLVAHYQNYYGDRWRGSGTLAEEQQLAEQTDSLIACSQAVAAHVAGQLGVAESRFEVVPNGVDLEKFRADGPVAPLRQELGLAADAVLVGAVGRVHKQKAPEVFVRAVARAAHDLPQCHFLWVGAGAAAEVAGLRQLADQLGVDNRLHWLGHRDDVGDVMRALDMFVLSSRWEGLPLVLVEAMAAGKPLVASSIGPVLELVQDGVQGLIFPVNDSAALAAAIVRLARDASLSRRLAAAAFQCAAGYSWARAAAQIHAIYQRLVQ